MSVSVELSVWSVQDFCTGHTGPPVDERQMHVVQGEIKTAGATASFGPLCLLCLTSSIHALTFSIPRLTGGRVVSSRRLKHLSNKQEQKSAAATGARVQPGSGSKTGYKGDARLRGVFREESKFTFAKSFNLTRAILDKIRGECQGTEEPVVNLEFRDKSTGRVNDNWVVVPRDHWEKLLHATTPDHS